MGFTKYVREKFILTTKDDDELLQILKNFNLPANSFRLNKMLNIHDLLEFSTEVWINSDIKNKLIKIADGNPEVLSIAHEFIDHQSQDDFKFDAAIFLQNIQNKDNLFQAINDFIFNKFGRAALAVISRSIIFNGLNRNDTFCKNNFQFYTKLRSLNYFYVQENILFFKPTILGEYITSQYYFSKGKISPAFDNLIDDANEEELRQVLATLLTFYKELKLEIYKDAIVFLLSNMRLKNLSDKAILNLVLFTDEGLKDSKIIFQAIDDLLAIDIENAEFIQINRFAIFCAKNKAYECAARWWEKLLETARLQNNDSWITALYSNLGLVYFNLKEYDEAVEWYRLAYEKFKALGNSSGIIQSLNNLALIYQKKGEWQHSIELYKKSNDEMQNNNNYKAVANNYATIAQIYKSNDDLDNAFDNYHKAMEWFKKSDDIRGLVQAFGNLGIISNMRKDLDLSIEYFQKALNGLEKIGDKKGIAQTSNNLALVYQEKGENEKAIHFFQLAIEKFKYFKNKKSLAQTYNNLALIYQQNKDYDESKELLLNALIEQEKLNDLQAVSITLNNLGSLYQVVKELDEAINCFQKSIELKQAAGNLEGIEKTYGNLGIVFQELKQFNEAIKAYQSAIEIMKGVGDLDGLAQTYANLGNVYYEIANYKNAINMLNQTLFYFLKQDSMENIKKVSSIISNIQKEMNEKEFSRFADAALNDVVKNGIQWGDHIALSSKNAQEILNRLKKKKKERKA